MNYDVHSELFFKLDEGGRRGHEKKLFKKRFRLDVNTILVTEMLIDGISSQKNVLNDDDDDVVVVVVLLILLKSMSRLSWNRRVTVCYEDSGRYNMAKACVDLCHQCL